MKSAPLTALRNSVNNVLVASRKFSNKRVVFTWGILSFCITFVIILLGSLLLSLLREPADIMVITGETEILEFRVANARLSTFDGRGFKLYGDVGEGSSSLHERCLEGAVEPALTTSVTYLVNDGRIEIDLIPGSDGEGTGSAPGEAESTAFFQIGEGEWLPGTGRITLVAEQVRETGNESKSCIVALPRRFAVWGPGVIGEPMGYRRDGPGQVLIEAKLDVYGRSQNRFFFGGGDEVYPSLQRPLWLPPGSQLEAPDPDDGAVSISDPLLQAFRGFLLWSHASDRSFSIHLSTEARELWLYPPGTGLEPERIILGVFTQIFSDPTIAKFQVAILVFVIVLPIVLNIFSYVFVQVGGKDGQQKRNQGNDRDQTQIAKNGETDATKETSNNPDLME